MTVKYKTVITKAGAIKLAAATVPNGKKINFTAMAIGDGGGTLPTPDANQTKLINEVWRNPLNKISQDAKNKNFVVAELLVPPERGGFWMREMGLYDDTGTLIAVGNMAESYKPKLAEGTGRAQTVRMVIMVSDIESVELTIDTSMVMATQDYVDDKLAEHEQSRRHPDATLKEKGFTQLSNATDSESESVAATPKAVKAAYDLAKGKYTAQDATTTQKGIVQLSVTTDSTSENLAATPKAVKALIDNHAFLKSNLLSEVKATGTAAQSTLRDNIGLKTAATSDVTTSNRDSTANRILKVGDYGLGNILGKVTTGIDFKSYQFIQGERLFVPMSTCTNIPPGISATDYYFINVICLRDMDASPSLMMVKYLNPSEVWFLYGAGASGSRAWSTSRVYTTGNKPSAIDVSAVESKGDVGSPGGTAWDNSWIGVTGGDGDIPNPGNDFLVMTLVGKGRNSSGSYQLIFDGDATTSNTGLRIYARGIDSGGLLNKAKTAELYHTGHKPTAADVGALSSGGGTLNGNLTVKNMIQVGGVGNGIINIGDNDSGLRSSVDGQVDLWSNNQKVGYWKSGTFSFTGQIVPTNYSNFDAKYQAKGNYTPAGQAYTKAESDGRYYTQAQSNSRFVQNVQLGAQSALSGNSQAPTGCVFTYVYLGERVAYKPVQIYINGAWRTVSG